MEHQNARLGATAVLPVSTLSEPLLLPAAKHVNEEEDLEAQLPSYGASFSRTCLNLTNAVSGIGVLSMPYAVSQGGWLSLVLFVLVGAVCYYTGTLIERCMRADPSAIASYPDIGQFAFGSYGRRAIAFFMYVELYLVAISFLVLEGDNLDKLFPGASFDLLMGYRMQGKQLFIALAAAVVLPTTWLKDLSVLAYVSAIGSGLPTSLGLYFVCFTGHAIYPTIYSSMRNNKHFSKVLLISSVLCGLNYGLTAVLGYMIYGDDVESQVTLNLPAGKLYSQVAIVMTLINPLANVMATVIFPCLCFLKIYKAEGIRRTEIAAIAGIMMIGVFVAITGTYTSLQQIIRTF
ncbi:hypothetical protein PR202_gb05640 [Eleusine coracana subsp. coracana]|uniref:Amino acid transporter transmembrane domain-containing protein n=1 Tax=Eleusine coracana subsp. coracana TaxID=191504 RepID=A0AAV5E5V2_ELECO|nr:hypothetical protein PR202_gb05640 [Eleusine coracana subsp. coracana]